MTTKVVVIGAGVVGVSVAEALGRKGVHVTLLERDVVGAGTSSTSYAWINSNNKQPTSYYELNLAGVAAHRRLAPQGAPWVEWGGHVEIAADQGHVTELSGRLDRLEAVGYPMQRLDPSDADLGGDVQVPAGVQLAVRFTEEGYCYPALYLAEMTARARQAGVEPQQHREVVGLEEGANGVRVTLADGEVVEADQAVVCAGRWTGELAALAGIDVPMLGYTEPGDVTVGYLAVTTPTPVRLGSLVTSPWLNVRPAGGGRLLLQALDLDVTAAPDASTATDSPVARELLRRLAALMPAAEGAHIETLMGGQRVMPADGLTIVGPVGSGRIYVVATHSGVTLAPFLGEAVSEELLGRAEPLLADFRPGRFVGRESAAPRSPRRPGEQ